MGAKPRLMSGVQPSGASDLTNVQVDSHSRTNTHLGNYVGARRSDRKATGPCEAGTLLEQVFDKRESYGP